MLYGLAGPRPAPPLPPCSRPARACAPVDGAQQRGQQLDEELEGQARQHRGGQSAQHLRRGGGCG